MSVACRTPARHNEVERIRSLRLIEVHVDAPSGGFRHEIGASVGPRLHPVVGRRVCRP
jgi:hypothetical protein